LADLQDIIEGASANPFGTGIDYRDLRNAGLPAAPDDDFLYENDPCFEEGVVSQSICSLKINF
jgi:hypothetical protein